ncbi:hypothetical protein E6B08_05705 [Pseudomonas putida]|uniref:YD repeat-containing protein n=1 Tax=Pseudomonas putida TaxID=303 RepID=A0A4D6XA80_PSEPU|nr:hypothetical protein [Pseudomonas putida]QCI10930.1 hypothetical protein E6B08_05705 [Pseudomonas putida]
MPSSNSAEIHSQSNNFLGVVQSAVNDRTGQFNLSISLPSLLANNLAGPALQLNWAFNSLASQSDLGYGLGWSLLMTRLVVDQVASSLQLRTGENFAVDNKKSDWSNGGTLVFHDYKLKAMQVTRLNARQYRIYHKNGETEILTQAGRSNRYVLTELRSPEGRRLHLQWRSTRQSDFLAEVRDEQRPLVRFERSGGDVSVRLDPDDRPSTVRFRTNNQRLSSVQVSLIDKPFHFAYRRLSVGNGTQLLFPRSVKGPLGASDTIHWSTRQTHRVPRGGPFEYLPRVTSWTHSTGDPANALHRTYRWIGQTNFLGYGSIGRFDWVTGRDNLYQVNKEYRYSVIETQKDHQGQTLTTITRQWDRFHLLTRETTVMGRFEVETANTYGIDPDKTWEQQSAASQLPHAVSTTYRHLGSDESRTETTTYRYDDYGNLLSTTLPTGVCEVYSYYPASGVVDECPPDSTVMVRHMASKTVTPAKLADGSHGGAPILRTRYRYEQLPSLIADEPAHTVVVSEALEDLSAGKLLEHTVQAYQRTVGPHYGELIRASTTLNGITTTTEYHHVLDQGLLSTTTVVQGFEGDAVNRSSSRQARCRLSGLTAWEESAAGSRTCYHYDLLGRIIATVLAADSDYQASRSCDYHLDDTFVHANAPQEILGYLPRACLEETDTTGQRRRTWLDGAGRAVAVQLEDRDEAPGEFRLVGCTQFDALGRTTVTTEFDWFPGQSQPLKLTGKTSYDASGQIYTHTAPTGLLSITCQDPIAMRSEHWQQGPSGQTSAKQVTSVNLAGSPVRQDLLDQQGRLVRTTRFVRDGLDRIIEEHLLASDQPNSPRITRRRYDAYGRIERLTREDGAHIVTTYAAHSDGPHPTSVSLQYPEAKG